MVKGIRVTPFVNFIKARERHRRAKEQGNWTGLGRPDATILKYRFCNVRRNDDRVTKYVLEKFLPRYRGHHWFAATVARLFNQPTTLEAIKGHVVPFDPIAMKRVLHERKNRGMLVFNSAYIVSTNGMKMDKIDFVVDIVLVPLWAVRHNVSAAMRGATLNQFHDMLMRYRGLGSFMAAQVVADIKYLDSGRWPDFHTFAASGPGSKRGLSRVFEQDVNARMGEELFRTRLAILRELVNDKLDWTEPLTAQDIQNCLCEFDKYERELNGEGRPKQLYTPFKGEDV